MRHSRYWFMSALLALSLLPGACERHNARALEVLEPVSRQTRTITAEELAHKWLVINYWAGWCKPCITEIPELNRFAQAERLRAVVIGVNFDNQQGAALQRAAHQVGMAFPIAITKLDSLFTLPEISGLPTTLILDEHGVLKQQLLGPQTYDSLEAAITKLQSQP